MCLEGYVADIKNTLCDNSLNVEQPYEKGYRDIITRKFASKHGRPKALENLERKNLKPESSATLSGSCQHTSI